MRASLTVCLNSADVDISDELKGQIEKTVTDAGISLSGEGELGGWEGGVVWLVPTTKPIEEWKPIAERRLTTHLKKAYATAGS
jgi:2',3'-cyclic-nucleotide 3'-phosphodiesterase